MNQKGFMFKKNSEYRPGSLGGSVKLVLAAFMALALMSFVASSAMAELKVSAFGDAAFGNYSVEEKVTTGGATYDTKADQGLRTDTQFDLNLSGGTDNISYAMRLRVNENNAGNGLTLNRHSLTWKASPQLSLIFNGESFGRGGLVGYGIAGGIGTMGNGTPIGDQYAAVTTTANTTNLDINFNLGTMNVGVMIMDECKPDCALQPKLGGTVQTKTVGDASGIAGAGAADKNQQTILAYFEGNFGAIHVGVLNASSSGDDSKTSVNGLTDNDVTYKGSWTNVTADFTTGDMTVGGVYRMSTQSGNSDAANGGLADITDLETTGIALGIKVAGIRARYSTVTDELAVPASLGTGKHSRDSTEIAAAYTMMMDGGVKLMPQFAQKTQEYKKEPAGTNPDSWEKTETYIALGISGTW